MPNTFSLPFRGLEASCLLGKLDETFGEKPASSIKMNSNHPTILVVEDERIVAEDIQDRLLQLNYAVAATTGRGEEAVSLARRHNPDLVLMDIRLQGQMDGIEAGRIITEELHLPVVFLTANSDNDTLERAKAAEPFGYLLKPFVEQELKTTIEMALYKHQAEMERRRLTEELQQALEHVKRLSGLLPICARCKNVRDDRGYWEEVETYISSHSEAKFTHGICPSCFKEMYPDIYPEVKEELDKLNPPKPE